ncbi:MAG: solute carrier family 23 protein, partial [Cetobacterium sp.]
MKKNRSPYHLDGVPELKTALPLGLQHILAMFVSNITPIIIVAGVLGISSEQKTLLIQASMFVAGLNTLIQAYTLGPIGAKLPIVVGTSFAFVPVAISIGTRYGFEGVLGAALIGGIFEGLLGLIIKRVRKFFPPIVTGVVVLSIGLSLLPV